MIYQTTVSLVWFFYRTDWLSLLRFGSWIRLRHFFLLFDLLTNWANSQNFHSRLSLVIFFVILCENSCSFSICSVLPKDHKKVIIVSAWLRTHIWVMWLSQIYRKIRPLPSVSLLFMLAWKIDFESQRHKIVWL